MSNPIDIFSNAKPQSGEFFKFKNVGDQVQGTYIDQREGVDSFGNDQIIYVLLDPTSGKIWNLGFRKTSLVIHERMKGLRFGTVVGFRFDEERPSKKQPGINAKIIRIYADPKFVDNDWLDQQKALESRFGAGAPVRVHPTAPTLEEEEEDEDFTAPANAMPSLGGLTAAAAKPRNEAVDAIRNLAKSKGLTNDAMTEAAADEVIEQYTGFKLEEANLTKIIVKLTTYSSK